MVLKELEEQCTYLGFVVSAIGGQMAIYRYCENHFDMMHLNQSALGKANYPHLASS